MAHRAWQLLHMHSYIPVLLVYALHVSMPMHTHIDVPVLELNLKVSTELYS